jgi:hypothetical protein
MISIFQYLSNGEIIDEEINQFSRNSCANLQTVSENPEESSSAVF